MTTVYMWDRSVRSNVGHASMQCRSAYLSWWPSVSLLAPSDLPQVRGAVRLQAFRKLDDDRRDEKQPPDRSIVIPSLDEPRILEWWWGLTEGHDSRQEWDDSVCPWTEFGWNSVRLVAAALREGTSNAYQCSGLTICTLFPDDEPVWTSCELRKYVDRLAESAGQRFDN